MNENNINSINFINDISVKEQRYLDNSKWTINNYLNKKIYSYSVGNSTEEEKIKQVGKEFEKIFLKYLVSCMFNSTQFFSEDIGFERIIWQDYFNEEIAAKISESIELGIADSIYEQITANNLVKVFEDKNI